MEKISDVHLSPLKGSQYLQPKRIFFNQNGTKRSWECIAEHFDVAILLFNISRNVFICVKQFRPAVYLINAKVETKNGKCMIDTDKYPGKLGVTIELCSGIIDKDQPLEKIVQAEALEECGYDVPLECIQRVTSFRNGVDITGTVATLFYAEVTDSMRTGPGGGLIHEGEMIEVLELSIEETRKLIYDEKINREAGMLFMLQWFFTNIWPKRKKEASE